MRIPRKIKKWKKNLYEGGPTLPERVEFKPSWFWMPLPPSKNKVLKVMRNQIRKIRKSIKIEISNPTRPRAKKLAKEDIWGHYDEQTHKMLDYGMIVARGCGEPDGKITSKCPDFCPVWKERLSYKSVTAICDKEQQREVEYWLEYVNGGDSISKTKDLDNGKVAIRSNYMCW